MVMLLRNRSSSHLTIIVIVHLHTTPSSHPPQAFQQSINRSCACPPSYLSSLAFNLLAVFIVLLIVSSHTIHCDHMSRLALIIPLSQHHYHPYQRVRFSPFLNCSRLFHQLNAYISHSSESNQIQEFNRFNAS